MNDKLLLKFRDKDTAYGVTRETLKVLSEQLEMTETMVIHLAMSRFANEILPAYAADGGPLSRDYLKWLRNAAGTDLHKGRVVSKKSLV
jgi:hypothetical protein